MINIYTNGALFLKKVYQPKVTNQGGTSNLIDRVQNGVHIFLAESWTFYLESHQFKGN